MHRPCTHAGRPAPPRRAAPRRAGRAARESTSAVRSPSHHRGKGHQGAVDLDALAQAQHLWVHPQALGTRHVHKLGGSALDCVGCVGLRWVAFAGGALAGDSHASCRARTSDLLAVSSLAPRHPTPARPPTNLPAPPHPWPPRATHHQARHHDAVLLPVQRRGGVLREPHREQRRRALVHAAQIHHLAAGGREAADSARACVAAPAGPS
jgi:hypothetical protein